MTTMTGSDAVTTYVGLWPCDYCGMAVPADLCSDECNEVLAFCEECSEKCDECKGGCEKKESSCQYGGGYTFVRPDERRKFQLLSGAE